MLLWRLSGKRHARAMNGGYGLLFDGRWNTVGHAVTYCATSPSLCVLEKLVHVEVPDLLPELVMVTYEVAGTVAGDAVELRELPADWRTAEGHTQRIGDAWLESRSTFLLRVPSAIVPIAASPDVNILANPAHGDAAAMTIVAAEPFTLDPRLFPAPAGGT